MVGPIYEATKDWDEPVCIAVLPDHYTPVEMRIHVGNPVPFIIYARGMKPDSVQTYDEYTCVNGCYGILKLHEFMDTLMNIKIET